MLNRDIEKLISEYRLSSCLECGKCTAICPMAEVFGDLKYEYSPRGIIEKILFDIDNIFNNGAIWYCLMCDTCLKGCSSDVKFRDFIDAIRKLAIKNGITRYSIPCKRCRRYFIPTPLHKYIFGKLKVETNTMGYLFICPTCRKYELSDKFRGKRQQEKRKKVLHNRK